MCVLSVEHRFAFPDRRLAALGVWRKRMERRTVLHEKQTSSSERQAWYGFARTHSVQAYASASAKRGNT